MSKKNDTTVGGVLLLQDLTTKAFIQNDRLVSKDFYKKKKKRENSLYTEDSKKQMYKYKFIKKDFFFPSNINIFPFFFSFGKKKG